MAESKKYQIEKLLLFVLLVVFPFGQLFRLDLALPELRIPLHLIDLVAGGFLLVYLTGNFPKPWFLKFFKSFAFAAAFSLVLSLTFLSFPEVLRGFLYLLRLISYFAIFLVTRELIGKKVALKSTIFKALIAVSAWLAIFGWVQYFYYPDFTAFRFLGWDDHLYRLNSTFLDPNFTGLILVFGFLASLAKYFEDKKRILLFLVVGFLVTLAFTYSRSSYLALFLGLVALISTMGRKWITMLVLAFAFLLGVLLLPRPEGEGVRLERVSSIYFRMENFTQSVNLLKEYPLFGVGYNNTCAFNKTGSPYTDTPSCWSPDSSLLLVLVTTGVAGFLIFLEASSKTVKNISIKNVYGKTALAVISALFVHSLFVNSLFYPWVMAWLAVLFGLIKFKGRPKEYSGE